MTTWFTDPDYGFLCPDDFGHGDKPEPDRNRVYRVVPVHGDYSKGFPPTLIQGGTKDIFLSNCVREYRAIDSAGGTAVLDIYEGMPHVFQGIVFGTPEAQQSMVKMKNFLAPYLGK